MANRRPTRRRPRVMSRTRRARPAFGPPGGKTSLGVPGGQPPSTRRKRAHKRKRKIRPKRNAK